MRNMIFLIAVVVLIIDGLIAREFDKVAAEKGYNDIKYFWISFFLGIVGYLLVIALPDRKKEYPTGGNTVQSNTENPSNTSSKYDDLPEQAFLYCGTIEDVVKKAEGMK